MYIDNMNEETKVSQEDYTTLITRVSEDIIIDNILNQIDNFYNTENLETRQSLFYYIEDRFKYLISKYGEDTEKRDEIRNVFDKILDEISNKIEDKIGIELEYSSIIELETKFNYVKSLYEFFIIDIESELVDLVVNYVGKNKNNFIKMFTDTLKPEERKNLSYQYLQKSIDNDFTPLIFHLDLLVETMEIPTNEDVIELMTEGDEDELSNFYVNEILVNNIFVDCNHVRPLLETLSPLLIKNMTIEREAKLRLIEMYK